MNLPAHIENALEVIEGNVQAMQHPERYKLKVQDGNNQERALETIKAWVNAQYTPYLGTVK